MKRIKYLVLVIAIIAPTLVQAQFTFLNDTVRIEGGPLRIGVSVPLQVYLYNENIITAFTLGYIFKPLDSGFAVFDSVVWVNRFADPQVLQVRTSQFPRHDDLPPDTVLTGALNLGAGGSDLSPGADVMVKIYFTGVQTGFMEIDSGFVDPAGQFFLAYKDGSAHHPHFFTQPIEIQSGPPPPQISSSAEVVRVAGGDIIEIGYSGYSLDSIPLTYELISLVGYDDSTLTPSIVPAFSGGESPQLSWNITSGDVGIWLVTVGVCDTLGQCDTALARIEVVTSQDYLIDYDWTEITSSMNATGLSHGNLDGDLYPEVIVTGDVSIHSGSLKIYDFLEGSGYTEFLDVDDDRPKIGLTMGFLNGDEYLDFVLSGVKDNLDPQWGVGIYHGQESGVPVLIDDTEDAKSYEAAVLADFTGDGWLDYLAMNVITLFQGTPDLYVYIYEGDSASMFHSIGQLALNSAPRSINSADFNNDGYEDLAIGTIDGVSIYLNDGVGGFSNFANYPQEYGVVDIQITNRGSDFNNDGEFDLCVATPSVGGSESEIFVYLGDGNGGFSPQKIRTIAGQVFGNTVGDFNNDAILDIAFVNGSRKYFGILFGDGDGTFTNEIRYDVPNFAPRRIDCLDMDLDGDLDIAIASYIAGVGQSLYFFSNESNPPGYSVAGLDILGSDNAQIELTSKTGRVLNHISSTIPSGEYYLRNADGNSRIDDFACVSVVESGEYKLVVSPKNNLPQGYPFSLEYTLGGMKLRLAKEAPMNSSGYIFKISPDGNSGALPVNGAFSFFNTPTFLWSGAGPFDFELATDIGFNNIIHNAQINETIYSLPLTLSAPDTTIYYWRVKPVAANEFESIYALNIIPGANGSCGDVDGGGSVNIGDAIFLLTYIFRNGDAPDPIGRGDTNGSGDVNIADATHLIKYIFIGGLPPICQ
ncbi:MAG: VCBS repeat-containing protein [candidate division Zixibacteria bacterium]|nr:VCBS repeat-containing protein [candidate division Zixibacteria bacterium]